MKKILNSTVCIATCLIIASCSTAQLDRLEWLGKEPPMMPVQPKTQAEPIKWPALEDLDDSVQVSNSLWHSKTRAYFKDQRAYMTGDILTVRVAIQDRAELDNRTERIRTEIDDTGAANFYGLEDKLTDFLPNGVNPANLINTSANMNNRGLGLIEREEIINTVVAAVVTDVLPNGNLVIYGSQEVRVNFEVRQLTIQGVIRPEDINPQNEILYSQIAEARISYGGKGVITDIQQPRIGNQLADIFSPF